MLSTYGRKCGGELVNGRTGHQGTTTVTTNYLLPRLPTKPLPTALLPTAYHQKLQLSSWKVAFFWKLCDCVTALFLSEAFLQLGNFKEKRSNFDRAAGSCAMLFRTMQSLAEIGALPDLDGGWPPARVGPRVILMIWFWYSCWMLLT